MKYKFKTAGKLTSFTPKNGLWNKSGIRQQRKMPSLIYFDPVWVGLKKESDMVNVIAGAFRMSNFYPISLPIFIHMTWTIWYGPYDMVRLNSDDFSRPRKLGIIMFSLWRGDRTQKVDPKSSDFSNVLEIPLSLYVV